MIPAYGNHWKAAAETTWEWIRGDLLFSQHLQHSAFAPKEVCYKTHELPQSDRMVPEKIKKKKN